MRVTEDAVIFLFLEKRWETIDYKKKVRLQPRFLILCTRFPNSLQTRCVSFVIARLLHEEFSVVFWWFDRNLSSCPSAAAHLRGSVRKSCFEAVILVWAKKRRVGEKERDVLITTLPRKLSHVGRRGGGRAGEKVNPRETLEHNESSE